MPQGELTRGITPIRCHSHNDYWRRVPLFDALAAGCTSVEADIWPADGLASPLVGHTRSSTTPDRTLRSLYIDPITAILEHRSQANGTGDAWSPTVFDSDDSTPASLVLLLDFKDRSPALWAAVQAQLQPLRNRGWLTRWDRERGARVTRAVTVVATGDAPFDAIVGAAHRDVFYDAPLDRLDARYDVSNSHYASVSMGRAVGPVGWSFWPAQRAALGRQIKAAAERGLVSRYWGTASMPLVRRDGVWKELLGLGVGVLNGDDVNCMAEMFSNRLA
ncbi:hypothetical protein EJ08DRAFT_595457 [Neofusicoccum parvum]|uniref:Uncharacterized protein n=1 Tax=Neofusicoccum parvum TaxID=310453 RepID=A0ACB5SHX1_9PEZI|nr:hypothetical protein EJ08DRAFT_595457 [Neofusicoccum parvum]